jgi:cytochrome b6-f complex iron-sulfur subunit
MDRRKFLGWVGLGLFTTSLPVVIAACSKDSNNTETLTDGEVLPDPPNNANNGVAQYIPVGLVQMLEQNGQILNEDKEIIVIKNPDNNELVALSAKCTHKGCLVNWKKEDNLFLCPCHQAEFSVKGEVLGGPTSDILTVYPVKEENGQILVEIKI